MKNKKIWFIIPLIVICVGGLIFFLMAKHKGIDFMLSVKNIMGNAPDIVESQKQSTPYISGYEDIDFASETTFFMIKEAYDKIDFYGVFEKENIKEYTPYKKAFGELLKNQKSFIVDQTIGGETEQEFYISDFGEFSIDTQTGTVAVGSYDYYYFDFDADGSPELCVTDNARFIYIFKYVIDSREIRLLHELNTKHSLFGMGKVGYYNGGMAVFHAFIDYDKNGAERYVEFFLEEYYNEKEQKPEVVYMVGLPIYEKNAGQLIAEGDLKNQMYYSERYESYFFRVTKEQYDELTKDYFLARDLAKENIKSVKYTYDELF